MSEPGLTAELDRIAAEANVDIGVRPHGCPADACSAHNALRAVAALRELLRMADLWATLAGEVPSIDRADAARVVRDAITRELAGKE